MGQGLEIQYRGKVTPGIDAFWWQVVLEAIELENTSFEVVQSSNDPYERRHAERPVASDHTKLLHPPRPRHIDNSHLVQPHPNNHKVATELSLYLHLQPPLIGQYSIFEHHLCCGGAAKHKQC